MKVKPWLFAGLLLAILGLVAQNQVAEHLLIKARGEVRSGKWREATTTLGRLSWISFGESNERLYLQGLCEFSSGHAADGLLTWNKLQPGNSFCDEAALKAGEWLEGQAQLSKAEQIYRRALGTQGPRTSEVRHALLQLLWQEGRLEEIRPLIRENWAETERKFGVDASQTIANLRAHLSVDLEVFPIDHVRRKLDTLAAKGTQDSGIAISLANISLLAGRQDEERSWISRLNELRSDDPAILRTLFRHALAHQETDVLNRIAPAIRKLEIPPEELIQYFNALAGNRENASIQIEMLEKYMAKKPGDTSTLETLSEKLIRAGDRQKAAEYREKRRDLDMNRRNYGNKVASDFKSNAAEMAQMAEKLGRWFEASAFYAMLAKQNVPNAADKIVSIEPKLNETSLRDEIWSAIDKIQQVKTTPPAQKTNPDESLQIPSFLNIAGTHSPEFQFVSGRTAQYQLPETMSGGLALIDYNNDGFPDIFALQGGPFPFETLHANSKTLKGDRLFRNMGDGNFQDVTEAAGLPATRLGYSHGASVGDIDNDGDTDLFVTRYGSYSLFLNSGDGRFQDVTAKWNLSGNRDWPTSSAFADFDNDGDLDLYVCHYVAWDEHNPRICGNENGGPISYCVPHVLPSKPDHLFRNDGGKFTDISDQAGITAADTDGRGLGVIAADFDDDGLVDLFVANDGTANFYFKNTGSMKFIETALAAGVSANPDGGYQAGMGVACGDFNNDLKPDILVTNFYGESSSYFENMGEGLFRERGAGIGLKELTRYRLGFGTAFADFNNDSRLDLVTANGHVNDVRPVIPYMMPAQLLLGSNEGKLVDISSKMNADFVSERLGRGLVVGDLDRDGRQDLVILSLDSPLAIFMNRPADAATGESVKNQFLEIKLEGVKSNRDGIGTKVTLNAGNRKLRHQVFGGGSYQSASDKVLHFGLNQVDIVDEIEIAWPSGKIDRHVKIKTGQTLIAREGSDALKPLDSGKVK